MVRPRPAGGDALPPRGAWRSIRFTTRSSPVMPGARPRASPAPGGPSLRPADRLRGSSKKDVSRSVRRPSTTARGRLLARVGRRVRISSRDRGGGLFAELLLPGTASFNGSSCWGPRPLYVFMKKVSACCLLLGAVGVLPLAGDDQRSWAWRSRARSWAWRLRARSSISLRLSIGMPRHMSPGPPGGTSWNCKSRLVASFSPSVLPSCPARPDNSLRSPCLLQTLGGFCARRRGHVSGGGGAKLLLPPAGTKS